MDDKVLWGLVIVAYVVPFAAFEIWRQARRGGGYEPDRVTGFGWGGFVLLLALWAIKVPAGIIVILAMAAGVVLAVRHALRAFKRSRPQ